MKYTIELTDTEYNVLTGFMDMISTEIKAEYFQKAKLEPTEKAWEDKLAEAKEFAYKNGLEDGNKIADKDLKEIQDSTYDVAYIKGVEDFENLFVHEHDYEQFFEDTYGSKDPDYNLYDLVAEYGAKKIINDFKKWQEEKKKDEKESIKVGDIIHSELQNLNAIITQDDDCAWSCIDEDGVGFTQLKVHLKEEWKRIGHTDELSQLLAKLRGEDND